MLNSASKDLVGSRSGMRSQSRMLWREQSKRALYTLRNLASLAQVLRDATGRAVYVVSQVCANSGDRTTGRWISHASVTGWVLAGSSEQVPLSPISGLLQYSLRRISRSQVEAPALRLLGHERRCSCGLTMLRRYRWCQHCSPRKTSTRDVVWLVPYVFERCTLTREHLELCSL